MGRLKVAPDLTWFALDLMVLSKVIKVEQLSYAKTEFQKLEAERIGKQIESIRKAMFGD